MHPPRVVRRVRTGLFRVPGPVHFPVECDIRWYFHMSASPIERRRSVAAAALFFINTIICEAQIHLCMSRHKKKTCERRCSTREGMKTITRLSDAPHQSRSQFSRLGHTELHQKSELARREWTGPILKADYRLMTVPNFWRCIKEPYPGGVSSILSYYL